MRGRGRGRGRGREGGREREGGRDIQERGYAAALREEPNSARARARANGAIITHALAIRRRATTRISSCPKGG